MENPGGRLLRRSRDARSYRTGTVVGRTRTRGRRACVRGKFTSRWWCPMNWPRHFLFGSSSRPRTFSMFASPTGPAGLVKLSTVCSPNMDWQQSKLPLSSTRPYRDVYIFISRESSVSHPAVQTIARESSDAREFGLTPGGGGPRLRHGVARWWCSAWGTDTPIPRALRALARARERATDRPACHTSSTAGSRPAPSAPAGSARTTAARRPGPMQPTSSLSR